MTNQEILLPTLRATFVLYARSFVAVAAMVAIALAFVDSHVVFKLVPLFAVFVVAFQLPQLAAVRTKVATRLRALDVRERLANVWAGRRPLGRTIGLQAYGMALCSNVTALWINVARIVLSAIALLEAFALGYVGYLLVWDYRIITSVGIAIVGGLLAWALGVTLLTFDFDLSLSAAMARVRAMPWRSFSRLRSVVAIGVRLALVLGSLIITAPYLTQIVFSPEISTAMARQNVQLIAARRNVLAAEFDRQIGPLATRCATLQAALKREISGTSGRALEDGPAAAAIRAAIAETKNEIAAINQRRRRELAAFDQASPAVLRTRYSVPLLHDDLLSRSKIAVAFRSDPNYRATERAVIGLLIGLFVSVISLKLFQPRSVSVYYSELLQDLYRDYRAGLLDTLISSEERARREIAPLRFAEWALSMYAPMRGEELERRRLQASVAVYQVRQDYLKQLESEALAELESVRRSRDETVASLAAVEEKIAELEAVQAAERFDAASREHEASEPEWSSAALQLKHARHVALRTALARQRDLYLTELTMLDSVVVGKSNIIRQLSGAIDASRQEIAVGFTS